MTDVEVSSRGTEPGYIALRVEHVPLDETDLKNGVDAIIEGGGGSFWKLIGRGHHGRPVGTMVGSADPTWQPLGVSHGVVSSGVLWNLLE
jgi:hypothetical protein